MLAFLLQLTGRILARLPEPVLAPAARLLGDLLWWLLPGRRRLALSNLHHAFPERPDSWRRRIGRESSRRVAETLFLALAMPFLDERRIRSIARLAPETEAFARDRAEHPRPVVFATVHFAYWEAQTWFPLLSPAPLGDFGIIYRPLDNPSADRLVKESRERHGMRLLSRRDGLVQAVRILQGRGNIGILVDQNAGTQGALTTFLGRVCSTTELPGILAAKCGAELRSYYPRRTGFWRVDFHSDPIPTDGTAAGTTLAVNRWLETLLSEDAESCSSWLWSHNRWRNQDMPAARLRLEARRNLLAAECAARGWSALPRRTRVWVRLPNWLGDVVMALPLLRALRASRPDAEITLVALPAFLPLLASSGVADHLHALPPRGPGYFLHFTRLRAEFPDVWILLTNSARGDLEARLAGAPQRFGLRRPGHPRPLLTHAWPVPAGVDLASRHQTALWEDFLGSFGLAAAPDRTPLAAPFGAPAAPPAALASATESASEPRPIGLIPGSENSPEKRWPVAHWRALIASLPDERFVLFGTAGDRPITAAVAAGCGPARVEDLAGRTDLAAFAERLRACRLVVTNDTGGMHLANAVGAPVIALFGPTNPVRTGPVFSAAVRILQPPGCPPAGGGSLAQLAPETVAEAIRIQSAPTRSE